jgi:hypothetical protein
VLDHGEGGGGASTNEGDMSLVCFYLTVEDKYELKKEILRRSLEIFQYNYFLMSAMHSSNTLLYSKNGLKVVVNEK